jgi:hypothetical protein
LILGILWLGWLGSVLAVIFGHVALSQIKRTGAAGRGLAIAGLVLGYVGAAIALGFLLIAVGISDNGSSGPGTSQGKSGTTAQAGIGAPVRDGMFEFTVTELTTSTKVGDQDLGKKAQGEFLMVHVTVQNVGDESQAFSGDDQKLRDRAGHHYTSDSDAAIYLDDSRSLYEDINPGNRVNGVVIFDVPKGTTPESVELHDSPQSGGAKVALG